MPPMVVLSISQFNWYLVEILISSTRRWYLMRFIACPRQNFAEYGRCISSDTYVHTTCCLLGTTLDDKIKFLTIIVYNLFLLRLDY